MIGIILVGTCQTAAIQQMGNRSFISTVDSIHGIVIQHFCIFIRILGFADRYRLNRVIIPVEINRCYSKTLNRRFPKIIPSDVKIKTALISVSFSLEAYVSPERSAPIP